MSASTLVGNSLKFSPPGSSITVRLECRDDGVSLEIADQGVGLEPDQLERVFEPFVQLRPGSDRAHMGTGLGLTRSAEHTSELQSLMRLSYAVFCLKKKTARECTQ